MYLNCGCEGKAEDLVVLDVCMCVVGEIFPVTSEIWWGEESKSCVPLLQLNCENIAVQECCCHEIVGSVETCIDVLWCCVNFTWGGMM